MTEQDPPVPDHDRSGWQRLQPCGLTLPQWSFRVNPFALSCPERTYRLLFFICLRVRSICFNTV